MAKGQLGQLLTVAVGVGASGNDNRGRNAQLVAAMVNQMSQLKFSRDDESEADHYGLKYMAQAGYDPSAMLDVMKILKEASGGQHTPEILATHPLPETRLKQIESEIEHDYPQGHPVESHEGTGPRRGQPLIPFEFLQSVDIGQRLIQCLDRLTGDAPGVVQVAEELQIVEVFGRLDLATGAAP